MINGICLAIASTQSSAPDYRALTQRDRGFSVAVSRPSEEINIATKLLNLL